MKQFTIIILCFSQLVNADELTHNYKVTGKYASTPNVNQNVVVKKSLPKHSHRCPYDGTVWEHTDESLNDQNDHKCPVCGKIQWVKFEGLNPQFPAKRVQVQIYTNCPNGNCPLIRKIR